MFTNPREPILLVDDESEVLASEAMVLGLQGITNVITCDDSRKVMDIMARTPCCVAVLDITMPHVDGIALLERISAEYPATAVIMLTGLHDISAAVTCVKKGAFDYIVKPVDEDRLGTAVAKALEHAEVRRETERLRDSLADISLKSPATFAAIKTADQRMVAVFRYVEAIAPTGLPVLVTGETGTGKELVARAIHDASGSKGEFVTVNCAGIDDQLFSDTLFGHVRDAYTGASGTRQGLIARAKGGTVFLDEIGDLKAESQVKLLRLLQESTYYPLGSDMIARAECQFVAATNADLRKAQASGTFRRDLFYRLQSHEVHLPPLRQRKDDIPLLLETFLEEAAATTGRKAPSTPPQLVTLLSNYEFPGNVRELRGMVFDAVSRHVSGVMSLDAFKTAIGKLSADSAGLTGPGADSPGGARVLFPGELPTVDEVENALVAEALKRTGGNKSLAAQLTGMARQTFRTKAARIAGE